MEVDPVMLGSGMVPFRHYRDGTTFRDGPRVACDLAFLDASLEQRDIDSVVLASGTDFQWMQVSPGPLLLDDPGSAALPDPRLGSGGGSVGSAFGRGACKS